MLQNWSVKSPDDLVDDKDGKLPKPARERAIDLLNAEVKTYDQFLTGDVYRVEIETEDDQEAESCGSYFGIEDGRAGDQDMAAHYVQQYGDPARLAGAGI